MLTGIGDVAQVRLQLQGARTEQYTGLIHIAG